LDQGGNLKRGVRGNPECLVNDAWVICEVDNRDWVEPTGQWLEDRYFMRPGQGDLLPDNGSTVIFPHQNNWALCELQMMYDFGRHMANTATKEQRHCAQDKEAGKER
jgi:hypothetical protein